MSYFWILKITVSFWKFVKKTLYFTIFLLGMAYDSSLHHSIEWHSTKTTFARITWSVCVILLCAENPFLCAILINVNLMCVILMSVILMYVILTCVILMSVILMSVILMCVILWSHFEWHSSECYLDECHFDGYYFDGSHFMVSF